VNLMLHLWESTVCAAAAALMAVALRHRPARVRYRIWLCASIKFLVPLSPLVGVGAHISAWTSPVMPPAASIAVRWLDRSIAEWTHGPAARWSSNVMPDLEGAGPLLVLVWLAGAAALTLWRWRQWRTVARVAGSAIRLERGREHDALGRVLERSGGQRRPELLLCEEIRQPGVIGLRRPTVLWPAGLSARLQDDGLDAVLSHETCHAERWDNGTALIQVLVETILWFHPVVWWIGARLVIERERACDEEVLQMGTDERSYAQGIIEVGRFALHAPSAFVAGAGATGLTERIERILSRRTATPLSAWTRALLVSGALIAAAAPVGSGVLRAQGPVGTAAPNRTSAQDPSKRQRPGKDITLPKPIHEVKPRYTPGAMQARIQGNITLEATVLASGLVGDVKVVRSLDTVHGLDQEALKAMKEWRFDAGTKGGKPVPVAVEVEMTFRLK
jgi:TonB family protein